MQKRVVVTGIGLITPLGVGARHSWTRLVNGHSGLVSTRSLPDYKKKKWNQIPCKVVAKVPEGSLSEGKWNSRDHIEPSAVRRLATFSQYGIAAAAEALVDSELLSAPSCTELLIDPTRIGVAVGSGIGSLYDVCVNAHDFENSGYRRVHPLMVPRLLVNMAAGNISIQYGIKGPLHAVLTACATGLQAIGDAFNFIQNDYADVMVCGGSESPLHPLALAGFNRARSVTTEYNDYPKRASRPFDSGRSGFVLGEGCGILVIEALDHALARGLKECDIYAEIKGYGFCGDSHHITAPTEDGDGGFRAMEMALSRSGLGPDQVQYVNAHATSTAIGDRAEINGLYRLFVEGQAQQRPNKLLVTSTKSATGHLLGAAGAVEAIFTAQTIKYGSCPPTLNLKSPGGLDEDIQDRFNAFDYTASGSVECQVTNALCNLFGFGGVNSSLCMSQYTA